MESNGSKNRDPSDRSNSVAGGIEEYQAEFRILFDNVSSGVAIYEAVDDGEDFIFVDFNSAAEEIEHIKKDEIIGKKVTEIFPGVRKLGLFDVFRRVYKTGTPEHLPVSIYKDDRIAGWRENYVYRLPSGRIVAVYDDIGARKRTELVTQMTNQCFRAIADYTYDWEVWVGPTSRVLWTNPAVKRVTGYEIREIMSMSDYPAAVIYERDRAKMLKAFQSALKGSTGNDIEFRIVRKDGTVIWAAMSWQPIFDDEGHPLGHRESIRDITARKLAEEALKKSTKKTAATRHKS